MKFEFEAVAFGEDSAHVTIQLNGKAVHQIPMSGIRYSDESLDDAIEHTVHWWVRHLFELVERREHLMKLTDGMVEREPDWPRWGR